MKTSELVNLFPLILINLIFINVSIVATDINEVVIEEYIGWIDESVFAR